MEEKELTLEEMMTKLDECVSRLEADDISLEESFGIYEQGMRLVKACNSTIDKVEKNVLKLEADGSVSELDSID